MPQNYYKSSRIQKKLPKLKDEQFDYTGMRIIAIFLFAEEQEQEKPMLYILIY